MQAQPHLIDPYARYELNLDLSIYKPGGTIQLQMSASDLMPNPVTTNLLPCATGAQASKFKIKRYI